MERTGWILTPDGFRHGTVEFDQRIRSLRLEPTGDASPAADLAAPPEGPWILPGFVDAHVHGGGGGDTMDGEPGLRIAAAFHASRGTTSIMATTLTAPFEALEEALVGVRLLTERPEPAAARVLGAHLEGPWISPARLGAQPPHARRPESWEVDRLLEVGPVRVATVAPEIDGGLELVERLSEAGIRVQIGHSVASANTVVAALDRGAAGFTHLFNAMSGFHHRDTGVAGAALAWGRTAELILDGVHVGREAFEMARRCLPRWYAVSDAIAATGMAEGRSRLGGQEIVVEAGTARLLDGTLAGSTSTLHDALRRMLTWGLPVGEAVRRVSSVPAAELGVADRGRLVEGTFADLVVTDTELGILEVVVEGQPLSSSA